MTIWVLVLPSEKRRREYKKHLWGCWIQILDARCCCWCCCRRRFYYLSWPFFSHRWSVLFSCLPLRGGRDLAFVLLNCLLVFIPLSCFWHLLVLPCLVLVRIEGRKRNALLSIPRFPPILLLLKVLVSRQIFPCNYLRLPIGNGDHDSKSCNERPKKITVPPLLVRSPAFALSTLWRTAAGLMSTVRKRSHPRKNDTKEEMR